MNECVPIELVLDENFQKQVIESPLPVAVVFEKSCWGTAQIIKPILEKVAIEYANRIKVFKYSLDNNSAAYAEYRIENTTTVLLFKEGKVIYRTGLVSKEEFKSIINSILLKS